MNSIINRIETVALRFGALLDRFVFLGGATTSLFVTDPAVTDIRPTKDIAVIVDVSTLANYSELEVELRQLGFKNVIGLNAPICRWQIENILVDVMPTEAKILGFANRWYHLAVRDRSTFSLPSGLVIHIVKPEYFIATKIEAYIGRGKNDFIMSHDIEDIITIVDGRPELVAEVNSANCEVRAFIQTHLASFVVASGFTDSVLGYFPTDPIGQERYAIVMERIAKICR